MLNGEYTRSLGVNGKIWIDTSIRSFIFAENWNLLLFWTLTCFFCWLHQLFFSTITAIAERKTLYHSINLREILDAFKMFDRKSKHFCSSSTKPQLRHLHFSKTHPHKLFLFEHLSKSAQQSLLEFPHFILPLSSTWVNYQIIIKRFLVFEEKSPCIDSQRVDVFDECGKKRQNIEFFALSNW